MHKSQLGDILPLYVLVSAIRPAQLFTRFHFSLSREGQVFPLAGSIRRPSYLHPAAALRVEVVGVEAPGHGGGVRGGDDDGAVAAGRGGGLPPSRVHGDTHGQGVGLSRSGAATRQYEVKIKVFKVVPT